MKKRRWLRWALLLLLLALVGTTLYFKKYHDEHQEITDPGVPEVLDLPDPDEVE